MDKILSEKEQQEGKIVRELLETMTEQEKEIFQAYLKGASFGMSLKSNM
jgi:hypothetical protein